MLTFISLFAGIGGFDLGLERAGMKCVGQVEIDPFCRRVLAHHWPHVKRVEDIHHVNRSDFEYADVICGGVPCQPASSAGKRRGAADDRWLWPETFRVVRLYKPAWCLFENVRGLTSLESGVVFDNLLTELESCGYEVQTFLIPACAVDAPHRRDRVFILAHRVDAGLEGYARNGADRNGQVGEIPEPDRPVGEGGIRSGTGILADTTSDRRNARGPSDAEKSAQGRELDRGDFETFMADTAGEGWGAQSFRAIESAQSAERSDALPNPDSQPTRWSAIARGERCVWLPEPDVGRVAHGVRGRVDRLRSLGNAVVPQIVEILGRAIIEADSHYD